MRLLFEKEAYELLRLFSRYFSNTCATVSEPPPMKSVHMFALALLKKKTQKTLGISWRAGAAFPYCGKSLSLGSVRFCNRWTPGKVNRERSPSAPTAFPERPAPLLSSGKVLWGSPWGIWGGRRPPCLLPPPPPPAAATAAEERGWLGRGGRSRLSILRVGHCWRRSLRLRYRKRTTRKLFCLIIVISALLENLRLSSPERGGAAIGMSHILIAGFILVEFAAEISWCLICSGIPRFAT